MKIVPEAVSAVLESAGRLAAEIDHFILPTDQARTPAALAKQLGISPDAVVDNQIASVGVAGAAQPLILLAKALESALPGQLILLLGFGQGCDAILFQTTDRIERCRPDRGLSGY